VDFAELAGAGAGGGWFMYWKFCAIAALGKFVVPGCWSTTLGVAGVDCANTGMLQATQAAAAAARIGRIIGVSFVCSIGWGGRERWTRV